MRDEHQPLATVAPLPNVAALTALIRRLQDRKFGLPGLGVFHGFSGFGKSMAAAFATVKFQAITVECKSSWSAKTLCQAILRELGLPDRGSIPDLTERIGEQLAISGRTLIIDETDHLMSRSKIEIVRDIYEISDAPIVLIGEETLPNKLAQWERVHGRVLSWVAAQPGTLADVEPLAAIYCPGIEVSEELRKRLVAEAKGSIRRICVNLTLIRECALETGVTRVDAKAWGDRKFFSAQPPAPRRGY